MIATLRLIKLPSGATPTAVTGIPIRIKNPVAHIPRPITTQGIAHSPANKHLNKYLVFSFLLNGSIDFDSVRDLPKCICNQPTESYVMPIFPKYNGCCHIHYQSQSS